MQITGGTVTYGRTVQPAQYESKKAEATIAFVLSEGEMMGDTLEKVKTLAMDACHEMVGLKKPSAPAALPAGDKVGAKEAAAASLNAKDKPTETEKTTARTPPKTRTKKDEPAADPAAVVEEPKANISANPEDRVDPAAIVDDPTEVSAAAITDADINTAVQKRNGEIKNPQAIRELIVKYVGKTPCRAVDVPAGVRQKFLDELTKLGAKA